MAAQSPQNYSPEAVQEILAAAIANPHYLRLAMVTLLRTIHPRRLLLALLVTFVIADTYPHPHLGSGLLVTTMHQITSRITPAH